MIYEQVLAGEPEVVVPHPLMQTSKQMREEVAEAAACYIGPRARLILVPRLKYQVDTVIEAEDPNDPANDRLIRVYTGSGLGPYLGPHTDWQELCCSHFGKQLLLHIRHIYTSMSMADIDDITIKFGRNAAPEIITKKGHHYNSRDIHSVESYEMFQSIAERYRKEEAGCSVEWVDAFMKETLDACAKIGHWLETRKRRWV